MPEYYHAKFGGVWTTIKGETEGAKVPPTSLNRVKVWSKSKAAQFQSESVKSKQLCVPVYLGLCHGRSY